MRELLLGLLILALISGIFFRGPAPNQIIVLSSDEPYVTQVNCQNPTGCYRLIGQAVDIAPQGSIIQIGPGIYYEPPFTIDRPMTLQGAGTEATKIILTDPRAEKPTVGIIILGNQAITVELSDLRIENAIPVLGESEAIKVFSQTTEEMQFALRDVYLQSVIGLTGQAAQFGGLKARGPSLNVEGSTIVADRGIAMESGQLTVRNSQVRAPEGPSRLPMARQRVGIHLSPGTFLTMPPPPMDFPPSVFLPIHVEAILEGNQIRGFSDGVLAGALSSLKESLSAQLTGNDISDNEVGVWLVFDGVEINLTRNEIHDNSLFGIALDRPPCRQTDPMYWFQGAVQGTENRFYGNKEADLCPALGEYPWPPDFIKNP